MGLVRLSLWVHREQYDRYRVRIRFRSRLYGGMPKDLRLGCGLSPLNTSATTVQEKCK